MFVHALPKPNGRIHPTLDLKALNVAIKFQKFCMQSTRLVIVLVQLGNLLTSVDIKDAYLHISIFLCINITSILFWTRKTASL